MSETFDWTYPGLDSSHFHALTNLLSLRNGGQAEPSSYSELVVDEDWDPDDDGYGHAPSVDSTHPHQISDSGHGRLKRRFLDSLAEFTANKKGGTAVACSTMKEAEDNVVIWIARNQGFSNVDKLTFDKMGSFLGSLSCNDADQPEIPLWEEMVSYHQNRIESNDIPNFRASFKAFDAASSMDRANQTEKGSVPNDPLSDLRTFLFDGDLNGTSAMERHSRLVIETYNLRRSKCVEELLYSSPSSTPRSKSLWVNICLLARLRVAFRNFKDIALTLPSFGQVKIILVQYLRPHNPIQRPLNLKQTFRILQLDLSPEITKAVLGQNWTSAKIESEFMKRQRQKLNVHAEVQMLLHLNTSNSSSLGAFPYFGCSKLSCFMCDRFIRSFGRFSTRGCHGRLFKPWTVPRVDGLLPGQANRTAKALLSVQKEVKKSLKAPVVDQIRQERTSVFKGGSVTTGLQESRSQRQLQIDRLKMKTEHDRVVEIFKRQQENADSSARHTHPTPESNEPGECDICEKLTTRRCSLCSKGYFCSGSCQEKASGWHLFTCSKRSLTSADYLWRSLGEDLMPEEEEVLQDFGFNNVPYDESRSLLLGVYQGLYLFSDFSAEDIHAWRIAGILVDKIKEFYYSIPVHSRGEYFPWFLNHCHLLLDRPMTKTEAEERMIETFYDKARPYLDIEDRNKAFRDLEPEEKKLSFHLLAGILHRGTPHPTETNWYSFGFVTCHSQNEESTLLDLFQLLLTESDGSFFYRFHNDRRKGDVQPVTFTQFWTAYQAGTLIQLMDSKGLRNLRSWLPFLEEFLSVPPGGARPSVWDLKQHLEINDPMEHEPVPSVYLDYGFMNCESFEEICVLMEIYRKVLASASPLELHQACIAGDLSRFASRFVRMKEEWRSLMRNPYPLEEFGELELRSSPC